MLEELERRNYSQSTVRTYVKTIEDLARYFNLNPAFCATRRGAELDRVRRAWRLGDRSSSPGG
jgi:spore coat polysaccharide biosynthesis protein SpsF (cytidylyltransferase family)